MRLRTADLKAAQDAMAKHLIVVNAAEGELNASKGKALVDSTQARDGFMARFGDVSVETISQKIQSIQNESMRITLQEVGPLRDAFITSQRSRTDKIALADREVLKAKEQLAQHKAAQEQLSIRIRQTNFKLSTAASKEFDVSKQIAALKLIASNAMDTHASLVGGSSDVLGAAGLDVDVSEGEIVAARRQQVDDCVSRLALVDVSLGTARTSLGRLREVKAATAAAATAAPSALRLPRAIGPFSNPSSSSSAPPCSSKEHTTDAAECPTCGQNLSLEQRAVREEELVHSVAALSSQREALGAQLKALRVAVDAEQKLVAEVAALDTLRGE